MKDVVIAVVASAAVLTLAALLLLWRFLLKGPGRVTTAARVEAAADGVVAVPVRALYRRSGGLFGGVSRNSLRPSLSIAPEGLRFRVIGQDRWPFEEIAQVDLREGLFGAVRLLFLQDRNRRILVATLGDLETARAVLAALPRTLPLSPAAATLRDGTAEAATPGLPRYDGPTH